MARDDYGEGKRVMHDDAKAKATIKVKLERSLLRRAGEKTEPFIV